MMKMIIFFVLFVVMEHQWNEIDRGKPKYSAKNLSQCHFVHHKSHVDMRDRTLASVVGTSALVKCIIFSDSSKLN
jgi:hypothetical protein